jgi:hypothetical protein
LGQPKPPSINLDAASFDKGLNKYLADWDKKLGPTLAAAPADDLPPWTPDQANPAGLPRLTQIVNSWPDGHENWPDFTPEQEAELRQLLNWPDNTGSGPDHLDAMEALMELETLREATMAQQPAAKVAKLLAKVTSG